MVDCSMTVEQAYKILGLSRDASVDELKSAYKKAALKTHPDKQHDDPSATARFQQVGEAYNTIMTHIECPSRDAYVDIGFGAYSSYFSFDDFFIVVVDESMNGGEFRHFNRAHRTQGRDPDLETEEQYRERIRREGEERKKAAERDKREREFRKERMRQKQERDKEKAELRRMEQAYQKKVQAEQAKRNKEEAVRNRRERTQQLRSAVFRAARNGDEDEVKKGVFENNVDAAGGEVRQGNEEFLDPEDLPKDPRETLVHIAANQGNKELIQWLIAHNAEADEKDSAGLTAFHIALKKGYVAIVDYFIESHPPSQDDFASIYTPPPSADNLRLALETAEPALVWMILEFKLAKRRQILDAWSWFCSPEGENMLRMKMRERRMEDEEVEGKMEEIRNLLMSYGKFTPPPSPKIDLEKLSIPDKRNQNTSSSVYASAKQTHRSSPVLQNPTPVASPAPSDETAAPYVDQSGASSPSPSHRPFNENRQQRHSLRGRGRGRGRGKDNGRGRGRGRGRDSTTS